MPAKGQQGFRQKSPELVAAEADIYARYQAHRRGEKISFREPALPQQSNPHEHAMLNNSIGFRVQTLWDAVDMTRQLLAA